jgi:hypothetical protein
MLVPARPMSRGWVEAAKHEWTVEVGWSEPASLSYTRRRLTHLLAVTSFTEIPL